MSRRLIIALGLALSGVAAAACGVGTQQTAQVIDRHDVPFGLLSPATPTTTTTPLPGATVTVFFEGPNGLVPVTRRIAGSATLQSALDQLASGPSAADSGTALQSPVSAVTPLVAKRVTSSVAWVSVPATFATLGGQDQIVAASQIVYTATAVPGITGVVLIVNGQQSQVPVGDGNLKNGPLTRADYPQ